MTTPHQETTPKDSGDGRENSEYRYTTDGGVSVIRRMTTVTYEDATEGLIDALDQTKGVLLSSSYEFPGRYSRWDMGFDAPPLEIIGRERGFAVHALNDRVRVLLGVISDTLGNHPHIDSITNGEDGLFGARKSTRLNSSHITSSYAGFCSNKTKLSIASQACRVSSMAYSIDSANQNSHSPAPQA